MDKDHPHHEHSSSHEHARRVQASVRGILSRRQSLKKIIQTKNTKNTSSPQIKQVMKQSTWGSLFVWWALGLEVQEARFCLVWSLLTLSIRTKNIEWTEGARKFRIESIKIRIMIWSILFQLLLWWRRIPIIGVYLEDVSVSLRGDEHLTIVLNDLVKRDLERRLRHKVSVHRAVVIQKGKFAEQRLEIDRVVIDSTCGNFICSNARWRWITQDGSMLAIDIPPNGTVSIRAQVKSTQLWQAICNGPKWPPSDCDLHLNSRKKKSKSDDGALHHFGTTSLELDLGNQYNLLAQARAFSVHHLGEHQQIEVTTLSWRLVRRRVINKSKLESSLISQGRVETVHFSLSEQNTVHCECDDEIIFEFIPSKIAKATDVGEMLARLCPRFVASAPEARLEFFNQGVIARLIEPTATWSGEDENECCVGDPFVSQRRACLVARLTATQIQCFGPHKLAGIHAVGNGLEACFENGAALARKYRIEPNTANLIIARPLLDLKLGQLDIKHGIHKSDDLIMLLSKVLLNAQEATSQDIVSSPLETNIRIAHCVCLDHVLGVVLARLYDDDVWPRTRLAIDAMLDDFSMDNQQSINLRCSRLRSQGWSLARKRNSVARFQGDKCVLDGAPALDVDLKLSFAKIDFISSLTEWSWIFNLRDILTHAIPAVRLVIRAEHLAVALPGDGDGVCFDQAALLLGTAPTEMQAAQAKLVAEYGAPAAHCGLVKARIVNEKERLDVLVLDASVDHLKNCRAIWQRMKNNINGIDFTMRLERPSFIFDKSEYVANLELLTVMGILSENKFSVCLDGAELAIVPKQSTKKTRREDLVSCNALNFIFEQTGIVAKSRAKFSVLRGALRAADTTPLVTAFFSLLLEPVLLAPSLRGAALTIEVPRVHIRLVPTAPRSSYLELTLQTLSLDIRTVDGKASLNFSCYALALLDLISSRLLSTAGNPKILAHRDAPDDWSPPSLSGVNQSQVLRYKNDEDKAFPPALQSCIKALLNEWSPTLVTDLATPLITLWQQQISSQVIDKEQEEHHKASAIDGRHSMLRASMNHGRLAHQGTSHRRSSAVSSHTSSSENTQNPLLHQHENEGDFSFTKEDDEPHSTYEQDTVSSHSRAGTKQHSLARKSILHARQAHQQHHQQK